jgi:hypothetical protein
MNDIAKEKTFQERMIDRIREDIGKLMTDEELSKIVERAMEEIFFKPTKVEDGWRTERRPPFVHKLIKDLLKDAVYREISIFITNNNELVLKEIKEVITQGMGKALMEALTLQFQSELMNFQSNIIQSLER